MTALEEYIDHPEIIIIRGDGAELQNWRRNAAQIYAPRRMVFAIPADAGDLPGALADRKPVDGDTIASLHRDALLAADDELGSAVGRTQCDDNGRPEWVTGHPGAISSH